MKMEHTNVMKWEVFVKTMEVITSLRHTLVDSEPGCPPTPPPMKRGAYQLVIGCMSHLVLTCCAGGSAGRCTAKFKSSYKHLPANNAPYGRVGGAF